MKYKAGMLFDKFVFFNTLLNNEFAMKGSHVAQRNRHLVRILAGLYTNQQEMNRRPLQRVHFHFTL